MAIRIDKDGTIIRDIEVRTSAEVLTDSPRQSITHVPRDTLLIEEPTWLKLLFWAVTSTIAAGICVAIFVFVSPQVFETTSSSGFIEAIVNFMCVVSPYLIFAGGVGATIFFNVKISANVNGKYAWWHFIVSILCCVGGNVATGLAMFLITIAVAIIIAILLVILGVAILIGIFSGG